jgi:uncharacterized glyoxalase superfamily protein PhnB
MSGIDRVSTITIAVTDENEALRWFTEKLGFEKRLDLAGSLRWLTVAPRQQKEVQFLLATWFPDHVGKNATCVVDTEDCRATYEALKARGVRFKQEPQVRPYGTEAVFQDLYGNTYALVEHAIIGAAP